MRGDLNIKREKISLLIQSIFKLSLTKVMRLPCPYPYKIFYKCDGDKILVVRILGERTDFLKSLVLDDLEDDSAL